MSSTLSTNQKLSLAETYKAELINDLCLPYDNMNSFAFDKLIKDAGDKKNINVHNPKGLRQIAKELLPYKKNTRT